MRLFLIMLIMCIGFVFAYSAPAYDSVDLVLDLGYTAQTYDSVDLVLGDVNVTETISISRIYPTTNVNVTQNEFFKVELNVTCLTGSCGTVNVSLDPWEYTGNSWDTGTGRDDPQSMVYYNGLLYIVDGVNDEVYIFHENGTYTGDSFDTLGSGNGNVYSIGSDNSYIFTVDGVDTLIYEYDLSGTFIDSILNWSTEISKYNTAGIASNGTTIWLSDPTVDEIYQYNFTSTSESKSGLINTTIGALPFYTNSTNPFTTSSLSSGQSETVTFWVNATGTVDVTHDFFAWANVTSNESISDTTTNWNVTIVEAGPTDSCTYTSGDWEIDCSDNCVISSEVNLGGNDMIFSNAGTFFIGADITNYANLNLNSGCSIIFDSDVQLISNA
ncbi:hypothetical protein KAR91_07045 [Candidatus Pacearchaeota archaeon]|nr:hypothetical protein [Candidatus Pacearchaeota archaeon]